MDYQVILDNDDALVCYYPSGGYLHHTIKQPVKGPRLTVITDAALNFLVENHVTKWLSDDRLNHELAPEDIERGAQFFGPTAAHAGWKYWALVVPHSIDGRASLLALACILNELGVKLRVFVEVEPAREWLLQQ